MDGDLIAILLAVLAWLVPSLLPRKGKSLRKALGEALPSSQQAQPVIELDEEDSDIEFECGEEREVESPSPYFSYEATQPEASAPIYQAPLKEEPLISEVEQSDKSVFAGVQEGSFDLRQAVIYQTILTNNYITDLK